ncbi:MAG: hypothetical protein JWL76_1712 [Thermoleophilia bacterium]|nr:hypothetical protein [Thermoleophilia bacterium]
MSDDDQRPRARDGHSGRRALLLLVLAVVVPVGIGLGLWQAANSHQLVPGLKGCSYVRDRAAQLDCYTDAFGDIVDERGLAKGLVRVDELAGDSATLGADCHVGWHPLGEAEGRADAKAGRDYDNITAKTTCQQGYAHGYTIGFIGTKDPSEAELARMVDAECGGSTGLTALFNCTHAYGHVIARQNKGDVSAGIDACERVDYTKLPGANVDSPIPGERPPVLVGAEHQCLYGLYMETSLLDVSDGDTTLDNCSTATSDEARKACYAYLPARVNAISGNLEDAAKACHEFAPKGDFRDSCVKTFSIGLGSRKQCSMLVAKVERSQCGRVIDVRENQDDVLAFADGDPDSFDANVLIAPEPGVEEPDAPATPPTPPSPGAPG